MCSQHSKAIYKNHNSSYSVVVPTSIYAHLSLPIVVYSLTLPLRKWLFNHHSCSSRDKTSTPISTRKASYSTPNYGSSPIRLGSRHILDYSSNEGIKLYNKATAPLETKYDLDTGHLYSLVPAKGQEPRHEPELDVHLHDPSASSHRRRWPSRPRVGPANSVWQDDPDYNIRAAGAEEYQFLHGRNAQNAHQMY
jgi:hypothetical protein